MRRRSFEDVAPEEVWIYLRLSALRVKSLSIASQDTVSRGALERVGLPLPPAGQVLDDIESASNPHKEREKFESLVVAIREGRCRYIACRDQDRLLRHTTEMDRVLDAAADAGNQLLIIYGMGGQIDTSSPEDRSTARGRAAEARGEMEKKSARQKENNEERAAQGLPHFAGRVFGYRLNDATGSYDQIPREVEALKWAHEYLLAAGTYTGVARKWNADGVLNSKGGLWKREAVRRAVLHPALAGLRPYQQTSILWKTKSKTVPPFELDEKDLVQGNWNPIITVPEWRNLKLNLLSTRSGGGNHIKYLGGGVYFCGRCPEPDGDPHLSKAGRLGTQHTTGTLKKRGRRRQYFCQDTGHMYVYAESIDDYVRQSVKLALTNPTIFRRIFREIDSRAGVNVAELERKLSQLESLLTEVEKSYFGGDMTRTNYLASKSENKSKSDAIEAALKEAERERGERNRLVSMEKIASRFDVAPIETQRYAVKECFGRIVVFPTEGDPSRPPESYVKIYLHGGAEFKPWEYTVAAMEAQTESQGGEPVTWRQVTDPDGRVLGVEEVGPGEEGA
ncbi:hypothetical protein Lfu02_54800 [Longispora fulva]|uniref:DNA invertase Pin-like site-specific DNA recombinase n=1 Tax=Longispora fulva TaxID=619741 RepID=A0A8J7GBQ0_9ACTN|nr:recombinase family protein [Longispora fulva]MBG6137538.1 DNA invertase Pin-like site-specific DNA recombinase [Longispora fulva]GIG61108.1 hypothetical protein Lfu02_54800 [Longispora fulva]